MLPIINKFMEIFSKRGIMEILIALVENTGTPLSTSKLNKITKLNSKTYYVAIKEMEKQHLVEKVSRELPLKFIEIKLTDIGENVGKCFKNAKDSWFEWKSSRKHSK